MKHSYFSPILVTVLSLCFSSSVLAIGNNTDTVRLRSPLPIPSISPKPIISPKLDIDRKINTAQLQQIKEERQQNRCEIVRQNVQNRIAIHEENREKYQLKYQDIVEKTQVKIEKLKSSGCTGDEINTVEQDISTLQFKIKEFKQLYETLLATLAQSVEPVCAENPDIGKQMQQVRDQLKPVREKATEIRLFIQSSLKPHLQDLRQTCTLQINELRSPKPTPTKEAE